MMNIIVCLTPEQIRNLDGSVLRASLDHDGTPIVVGVRDRRSPSGITLGKIGNVRYLYLSPSRNTVLREKGSVEGLSDTGSRVRVYDVTRTNPSPNLF